MSKSREKSTNPRMALRREPAPRHDSVTTAKSTGPVKRRAIGDTASAPMLGEKIKRRQENTLREAAGSANPESQTFKNSTVSNHSHPIIVIVTIISKTIFIRGGRVHSEAIL